MVTVTFKQPYNLRDRKTEAQVSEILDKAVRAIREANPNMDRQRGGLERPPRMNQTIHKRSVPRLQLQQGDTVRVKIIGETIDRHTDFTLLELGDSEREGMLRGMSEACNQKVEMSGADFLGKFEANSGFCIFPHPTLGWLRGEIAPRPEDNLLPGELSLFAIDHGVYVTIQKAKVLVMRQEYQAVPRASFKCSIGAGSVRQEDLLCWQNLIKHLKELEQISWNATIRSPRFQLNHCLVTLTASTQDGPMVNVTNIEALTELLRMQTEGKNSISHEPTN